MANLSDWLATADEAGAPAPEWLAAMTRETGFREGVPFAEVPAPSCEQKSPEEPDDAVAKAFADGEASGRAAAESEASQRIAALRSIRTTFSKLDAAAMDALAEELTETVKTLCDKLFDEIALDEKRLLERARVAAGQLGTAGERIKLRLNPADIEALGSIFPEEWGIMSDPAITRGGLIVEGEDGTLHDGPDQWRRAISDALKA